MRFETGQDKYTKIDTILDCFTSSQNNGIIAVNTKQSSINTDNNINVNINKDGCIVPKSLVNNNILKKIKKDLILKPKTNSYNENKNIQIKLYSEDKISYILPRNYGMMLAKEYKWNYKMYFPKISTIDNKITFTGELRDYQIKLKNKTTKKLLSNGGGIIVMSCGLGKCHGINTPIMMYNSDKKMVQDIKVGDVLMGDDSKPRKVESISSGIQNIYCVTNESSNTTYTVNEAHILTLYEITKNNIIDMTLQQYLKLSDNDKKRYTGIKTSVINNYTKLDINPYIYGILYARSISDTNIKLFEIYNKLSINTNTCFNTVENHILALTEYKTTNIISDYIQQQDDIYNFNEYGDSNNIIKHVINNSVKVRVLFLAGIIDFLGKYDKVMNTFTLKVTNNIINYLLDSLCFTYLYNKNNEISFVMSSENYEIPSIYSCMYDNDMEYKKYNSKIINRYPIKISKKGVENYFGFTLDNKTNSRYLLGDGTITHNTVSGIDIIADFFNNKHIGKAIVIVNSINLLEQWIERFAQYSNLVVRNINDTKITNSNIDIAMIKSVANGKYGNNLADTYDFALYDEVHHLAAEYFSKALKICNVKYMLGLTATPDRTDGLSNIFYYYIGSRICRITRIFNDVEVYYYKYESNNPLFKHVHLYGGKVLDKFGNKKLDDKKMLQNLVSIQDRYIFISNLVFNRIKTCKNAKILILVSRKNMIPIFIEYIQKLLCDKAKNYENIISKLEQLYIELNDYKNMEIKYTNIITDLYNEKTTSNMDITEISISFYLDKLKFITRQIAHFSLQINYYKSIYESLFILKNIKIREFSGSVKKQDRITAQHADIIVGTTHIAEEALDIKGLNTLFIATPKSKIEQAVGRILRSVEYDVMPRIYDISDQLDIFRHQGYKRIKYYMENKYHIHKFNVLNTTEYYEGKINMNDCSDL